MLLEEVVLWCCWCLVAGVEVAAAGAAGAVVVRVYENHTVLLPCHIDDSGLKTRVRWWKNEALLADSEEPGFARANPRVNMWGNQSLELVQVRPEDSGEYLCRASRPEPFGYVTQVHEIQVMYPASAKPVPESGLIEADLGEEVELRCETSGVPKPSLSWSFRGQELPTLASERRSLRILANNQSLAGVYSCLAANGIDEPARADIELKIRHKPEVRSLHKWVYSAPGIRTQLECQVVAWPEAKLEWYFDGKKLERSRRFLRMKEDLGSSSAQLYTLVIRNLQEGDLGQYRCEAENEKGRAEAWTEVSGVPRPPHLKRGTPSSANGYLFIWEVESYSRIVQYQLWFKQVDSAGEDWRRLTIPSASEPEGPLHAHSFNLTGLDASRRYEALVLARNRFGWSSPSKVVRFSLNDDSFYSWGEDSSGAGYGRTDDGTSGGGGGVDDEEIPPAVQVTSNSDRSSSVVVNSCGGLLGGGFLVTLPPLLLPILFRPPSISDVYSS